VRLHYTPGTLAVEVDDGTGNGTRAGGLRARPHRHAGTGVGARRPAPSRPQDGGGFRVGAELPARAPSWSGSCSPTDEPLIRNDNCRSLTRSCR